MDFNGVVDSYCRQLTRVHMFQLVPNLRGKFYDQQSIYLMYRLYHNPFALGMVWRLDQRLLLLSVFLSGFASLLHIQSVRQQTFEGLGYINLLHYCSKWFLSYVKCDFQLLDVLLGHGRVALFRRAELKTLVDLHGNEVYTRV